MRKRKDHRSSSTESRREIKKKKHKRKVSDLSYLEELHTENKKDRSREKIKEKRQIQLPESEDELLMKMRSKVIRG